VWVIGISVQTDATSSVDELCSQILISILRFVLIIWRHTIVPLYVLLPGSSDSPQLHWENVTTNTQKPITKKRQSILTTKLTPSLMSDVDKENKQTRPIAIEVAINVQHLDLE
jgi:hypothetical protein